MAQRSQVKHETRELGVGVVGSWLHPVWSCGGWGLRSPQHTDPKGQAEAGAPSRESPAVTQGAPAPRTWEGAGLQGTHACQEEPRPE